ncbi:hypothetical protein MBANPS3_006724 [Mucor bainieri]
MEMQVPMGQLLLQQGYFNDSTIPAQLHQSLQQQSLIQDPQVPSLEQNSALQNGQTLTKPKRQQVKNACVHCQKACKKCDDGRPCQRCLKYNLADTCRSSIRKERQKGMKRGPYKRKAGDSNASQRKNKKLSSGQTAMIASNVISQAINTQTTCSPMPVLPAFVTPDVSPNNNKDVYAQALTTATTSLCQSTDCIPPYTFNHHDLLMMPFSFAGNATTLQQDQFLLATTTTSHDYDLNKQHHLINDVPTYSTPTASPAAAVSVPQFRFISQNDFTL